MPEFVPVHSVLASFQGMLIACHDEHGAQKFETIDSFCLGYLKAAEWLYPEDEPEAEGWSQRAIITARTLCSAFQDQQALLLERFRTLTGRDDESCGHDYYLSSNGHGVGFDDREGAGDTGQALTDSCLYTGKDLYRGDDGLLYFM